MVTPAAAAVLGCLTVLGVGGAGFASLAGAERPAAVAAAGTRWKRPLRRRSSTSS